MQMDSCHWDKGRPLGKGLLDCPPFLLLLPLLPRETAHLCPSRNLPLESPRFPYINLLLKAQGKVDVRGFTLHLLRLGASDSSNRAIIIQSLSLLFG